VQAPHTISLASVAARAAAALLAGAEQHMGGAGGDGTVTPVSGKRKRSHLGGAPPERPQRPRLSEVLMRRARQEALQEDRLA